ncbi:hypothetical protein D3C81_1618120 [compost metagenome]
MAGSRPAPGRITTSAPAKPASRQSQRSADMRSPNSVAAASAIASGVRLTTAVNSPTGSTCRLKNAHTLDSTIVTARVACSHGLRVRSRRRPRAGSSTAPVNAACAR